MNFCPNCGAKIAPNAKFCTSCGQPLAEPTKSTNNESAEEDIYSTDENEDDILEEETNEIEDNETEDEDEYKFEDEELTVTDTEEDKTAKEEKTEPGTISGLQQRKLAIDQFLRTRKDYSKMKQNKLNLSLFLTIVLSLVCTGIVFFVVAWIFFGLFGLNLDNWSKTAIIIVGLGVLYVLWKVLKWFFLFFMHLFVSHFCCNFVDKYADEICATLPVSKRDISRFCQDNDCIFDLMTKEVSSIKLKSKPKSKQKSEK